MKILLSAISTAVLLGSAQAASVFGINFNNGDAAGAQEPASTFGATWTDLSDSDGVGGNPVGGTAVPLNGTSATVTWSAANFWQAGSWTGTDGFNSGPGVMRVYIDDSGGGYSVSLNGMSAWLAAEGATSYNVTLYASTDSGAGTGFEDATVGSLTMSIPELGDGTWDGVANDPNGNIASGFRGSATFVGLTDDVLSISSANASGARGTLAGIVVTAIPEPSSALLALTGAFAFVVRRRRK